jgi:hypothetical protein
MSRVHFQGDESMTKRCRHEWDTKVDYPNDRICHKCQRIITLTDYKTPKAIMTLPLELRRELMAEQAKQLAEKYPSYGRVGISEQCELFDCQVIIDITVNDEYSSPNRVFALGELPEMAAGLWGYILTPYFSTLDELELYCISDKGKDEINKEAGRIFPQWDSDKRAWK